MPPMSQKTIASEIKQAVLKSPHSKRWPMQQNAEVMVVCAKIEEEVSPSLSQTMRSRCFLMSWALHKAGLISLIQKSYKLLNLISFLTAGEKEVRAWTISYAAPRRRARQAKIHTDFERGFIRAEIVAFADLKECGNMAAAKSRGSCPPRRQRLRHAGRRRNSVQVQCIKWIMIKSRCQRTAFFYIDL